MKKPIVATLVAAAIVAMSLTGCTSNVELDRTIQVESMTCDVPSIWAEDVNETDTQTIAARDMTMTTYRVISKDKLSYLRVFASNISLEKDIEGSFENEEEAFKSEHVSNEQCSYSDYQSSIAEKDVIDGHRVSILDMSIKEKGADGNAQTTHQQEIHIFGASWHYFVTLYSSNSNLDIDADNFLKTVSLG